MHEKRGYLRRGLPVRRLRIVLCSVYVALAVSTACSDSTVCAGEATPGIRLTVLAPDGTDISRTSWVVVVRTVPSPPAPADSAQGYHDPPQGSPLLFTYDSPGQYVLRISHDGYQSEERAVTVSQSPQSCVSVITEDVTVTMTPSA